MFVQHAEVNDSSLRSIPFSNFALASTSFFCFISFYFVKKLRTKGSTNFIANFLNGKDLNEEERHTACTCTVLLT